jgi:hypothetical protein
MRTALSPAQSLLENSTLSSLVFGERKTKKREERWRRRMS